MDYLWKVSVSGVWGPNAIHNENIWGGPDCASTSTTASKFLVNVATVRNHV